MKNGNQTRRCYQCGWVLMLVIFVSQASAAMTASEAISLLEMRRAEIQDYYLVYSMSSYEHAYSMDKASEIAEEFNRLSLERKIGMGEELDREFSRKHESVYLYHTMVLSSNLWNGGIYTANGIGSQTYRYSSSSVFPTMMRQLQEHLSTPDDEFSIDFWSAPQFQLNQVMLHTPQMMFDVNVSNATEPMTPDRSLFQPNRAVDSIARPSPNQRRSFIFPFVHEIALDMAEGAEIDLQPTSEGAYRLRVKPADSILLFEVTINEVGDVLEFVRKHVRETGEEWVEYRVRYDLYVKAEPGNVRLPLLGVKQESELIPDRGIPVRESLKVININFALVNVGYSLDDLSVTLPAGSTIVDRRTEAIQRIEFDEDKEITAAQLVSGVIE